MGKFTCGCLNVKIHTKSDLKPINVEQLGVSDLAGDFFSLDVSEVQLDLEGISVEHGCLIREQQEADWIVKQCVNCDMMTHAVHKMQGTNKVLVNTSLKTDPTIIARLELSPDYSPLYKIVLHSKNDNHPIRTLGLQSGKYESLQEHLTQIQQQLNKFLISEETLMEERIRQYEEAQRAAYAELQSKARRDKNAMISLVLAAEDQNGGVFSVSPSSNPGGSNEDLTASSESIDDQPPPRQARPPPRDKQKADKSVKSSEDFQSSGYTRNRPKLTKTRSAPKYPAKTNSSPDGDDLFAMDMDLQGDTEPFYESDDENEDTDDSGLDNELRSMWRQPQPRTVYSTSVPISIPAWRHTNPPDFVDDDIEEESQALDPEQMAASIKALAMSVHEDGTEIFGDRPRPRLNTLGKY